MQGGRPEGMSELEWLVALEEIRQLKARRDRYADALSHNDGYPPWTSSKEMIENARRIMGDMITVHHSYDPDIVFDSPTQARGIWTMTGGGGGLCHARARRKRGPSVGATTTRLTTCVRAGGCSPADAGTATSAADPKVPSFPPEPRRVGRRSTITPSSGRSGSDSGQGERLQHRGANAARRRRRLVPLASARHWPGRFQLEAFRLSRGFPRCVMAEGLLGFPSVCRKDDRSWPTWGGLGVVGDPLHAYRLAHFPPAPQSDPVGLPRWHRGSPYKPLRDRWVPRLDGPEKRSARAP